MRARSGASQPAPSAAARRRGRAEAGGPGSTVPSPPAPAASCAAPPGSPRLVPPPLPDVAWRGVASFLPAPDLLSLLSSGRPLRAMGEDAAFWGEVIAAQFPHHRRSGSRRSSGSRREERQRERPEPPRRQPQPPQPQRRSRRQPQACSAARDRWSAEHRLLLGELGAAAMRFADDPARAEYLALSYRRNLRTVRWRPLEALAAAAAGPGPAPWLPPLRRLPPAPSAREGHLSCVLGGGGGDGDGGGYLVVTGGFCDDGDVVHVMDLGGTAASHPDAAGLFRPVSPGAVAGRGQEAQPLHDAYGATLTPINDRQAVRFGGFRSGGYRNECCQVAILTVEPAAVGRRGPSPAAPPSSSTAAAALEPFTATWEVVSAAATAAGAGMEISLLGDDDDEARIVRSYLSRAYHTATLLFGRYLVVLGGMQAGRSVWNPAVLDTRTWTWHLPRSVLLPQPSLQRRRLSAIPFSPFATPGGGLPASEPSPRHGHSAVWDPKRSRLVVFGGGTGNNLLRSGSDNAEVWATAALRPEDPAAALLSCLLGDEGAEAASDSAPAQGGRWRRLAEASSGALSPAEALCLGRCHVGHRVAPDAVLLALGSGRPSTNGVLGFNLEAETFFRPRVAGPLPAPRFTATSVLWNSYVIVHGGYSTQASSALGDMHLLDLAPALGRPLGALRQARGEAQRRGWPPVTDQQAVAARGAERDERILFRLMIDAVHDDDDLDDRNLDEEMEE